MPAIHTIDSNPPPAAKTKKKTAKKASNFSNASRVLGSSEVKPAKAFKQRKADELDDEEYAQPEADFEEGEDVGRNKKRRRAGSEEEDATYSPSASSSHRKSANKAAGKSLKAQEQGAAESMVPESDGKMQEQEGSVSAEVEHSDLHEEDVGPTDGGEEGGTTA